jgi:molybdopterin molybdotransferase
MDVTTNAAIKNMMVSVEEAERLIFSQATSFGTETISIHDSLGRITAEELIADRDLPPYDRVTMDGIAMNFKAIEQGISKFRITSIQAAGEMPREIAAMDECVEVMTGAALPFGADTIIRYEDLLIENDIAQLQAPKINKGQNIHFKGSDKMQGEVVVPVNTQITTSVIGIAASIGKTDIIVKRLPKCVVISTGDELIDIGDVPDFFQIRRSNVYCIEAILKQFLIQPDLLHIPDDEEVINNELLRCLQHYDVILLSGGVSMGKFDLIPKALANLGVDKLFHKVQQRPGKPFWFGCRQQTKVFAFPGNPNSTFLCLVRYFLPWLRLCLGEITANYYAVLDETISFEPSLTYFLPVTIRMDKSGRLLAAPVKVNGSGDFSSLVHAAAFMELPADKAKFDRGEIYKIWPLQNLISV